MIHLRNNFHIIESCSEFPNLKNRKEIFCDIESKRVFDHDKLGGLYPWKGDRICGIAISADDIPDVWYIPVRHSISGTDGQSAKGNLPVENVMDYMRDILTSCYEWINHFVKFDAMMFAVGDNVQFDCRLVCTLNLAKLYYSDRWSFGLKSVCQDWLDYDTGSMDRVKTYLNTLRPKSKSYADVPINLLGEYACDDVRMNRKLYRFLQENLQKRIEENPDKPQLGEAVKQLIETETLLTPVLFDMEKEGLRINEQECNIESLKSLRIMIHHAEEIEKISGKEFTNSNACLKRLLLDQYKLPVLITIKEKQDNGRWVDTGRPSFDKDAMALYKVHPSVTCNENIKQIVNMISEYRSEQQYKSLFLDTFLELNVNGYVHPNYKQSVKTGRLSCSTPNSQQQNERSKKLIHPHPDEGFTSNDYSQIEYRMIVHYCQIIEAIKAYNEDPKTDYHRWVANVLRIKRTPAKQLNFGMAFGQGKRGVTEKLMSNEDIMKEMGDRVNALVSAGVLDSSLRTLKFLELCRDHAIASYNTYHQTLPEIKVVSKSAATTAEVRGFVFNRYGRRRYLPGNAARKAFNTIMQSSAADIMKERMVAISPRYNSDSKSWGIRPRANVHDELLQGAPLCNLYNPKLHSFICDTMENTAIKYRVPILTGLGLSPNNWSEACGDNTIIEVSGKKITGDSEKLKEEFPAGKFIAGKLR